MELWVKLSIWIGTFGFFKEFRPEDPYIVQYLTGHKMNFTDEQVGIPLWFHGLLGSSYPS
jgi:Reduced folate carrier.